MTVKAGIVFGPHTLKIVGFADEWQNSPDAIITALDSVVSQVDNIDDDQKDNKKTTQKVGNDKFAEDYFVYYFTTWAYKKPFKLLLQDVV